ncbi:membrane-fusion protein [Vibrio caribbeanicus ATCC BAA-2122]|uniref:Membrane-fusion protein n=2 Tax=Vibrio caribbeanicus TaxID=701175 RepID=E3BII7_9VIBR|nr:membrane-fusion protein [Vibrio caribbeanicus ATCC BAA-2122]
MEKPLMRSFSMDKTTHLTYLCLFFMIFTSTSYAQYKRNSDVAVVTERVKSVLIPQVLELIGKFEAEQAVDISSQVNGKVVSVPIEANQKVELGQLLIKLDDEKAIASLAEAKAYLKNEKRKLSEFERLLEKSAMTQTEIDAQQANVDIAISRLDLAQANLNDLHIRAPFRGNVGLIDFSRGKMVSAGESLLSLDDLSIMQLDLQVPERYLAKLSLGAEVEAKSEAWPDEIFYGKVVALDNQIDSNTLNIRVRSRFLNDSLKLKPGMLVSARINFSPVSASIIPVKALEYSGTKRFVYVVGDNDKVDRREVQLGARADNQVVIEKGLLVGEQIVTQGLINMRDGVKVKVLNETAQSDSSKANNVGEN